jgi:hypothetical protein
MSSAKRLARLLLIFGGLGALGALFGPSEPWAGVDLGATGAAVVVLSLGAAIWLFAVRGEQIFDESAGVAERRARVGLIFIAVLLLTFLRQLWVLSGEAAVPEYIHGFFAHQFVQRLFVLIIAWSVISHLTGRGERGVEADERDLRLRAGADRAGDWALTLIVIAGICVLASVPASRLAWWLSPIVLANLLIGMLITKSLVEHVALALAYRAARA